ncbi:MAG: hypothetical protein AAGJ51_13320, partial [Pseudomonadota bacterium]
PDNFFYDVKSAGAVRMRPLEVIDDEHTIECNNSAARFLGFAAKGDHVSLMPPADLREIIILIFDGAADLVIGEGAQLRRLSVKGTPEAIDAIWIGASDSDEEWLPGIELQNMSANGVNGFIFAARSTEIAFEDLGSDNCAFKCSTKGDDAIETFWRHVMETAADFPVRQEVPRSLEALETFYDAQPAMTDAYRKAHPHKGALNENFSLRNLSRWDHAISAFRRSWRNDEQERLELRLLRKADGANATSVEDTYLHKHPGSEMYLPLSGITKIVAARSDANIDSGTAVSEIPATIAAEEIKTLCSSPEPRQGVEAISLDGGCFHGFAFTGEDAFGLSFHLRENTPESLCDCKVSAEYEEQQPKNVCDGI